MTDKELTEAAARAIGKAGAYDDFWEGLISPVQPGESADEAVDANGEYTFWNPLQDDGEALRLAVRLKMKITVGNAIVMVERIGPFADVGQTFTDDPQSATRRAIVRAAAAEAVPLGRW